MVIKRHKLPIWSYFLESKFDPNVKEAKQKMSAIYEVANKWGMPINVQLIVSSPSHEYEMEKARVAPILKQNKKIVETFEEHFGKDWRKRFDKEVSGIMIK
jgi:hypothetical protein